MWCDVFSQFAPLDSWVLGATLKVGDATSDLVEFFLLTIIPVSRYLTINLFQMVWICLNASQRWIGCFERWWLFPTSQMYFSGCKNSGGMHLGDFRDTNRVKAVFYYVQATHLWPQPWHIFGSEKGQVAIFQKRTAWACFHEKSMHIYLVWHPSCSIACVMWQGDRYWCLPIRPFINLCPSPSPKYLTTIIVPINIS